MKRYLTMLVIAFILVKCVSDSNNSSNDEIIVNVTKFPLAYHGSWIEMNSSKKNNGYEEIIINQDSLFKKWHIKGGNKEDILTDWTPMLMKKITIKNIDAEIDYCLRLEYDHGSEVYILSGYNMILNRYDSLAIKYLSHSNVTDSKYIKK